MDGHRVPGEWALDEGPAVLLPDALGPGRTARLAGAIVPLSAMGGPMACADELPDGLVIADHAGRVLVFNHAASRLTGIPARAAHGADVRQILPLRDADGRCWWASAKPYRGLSFRSRHPEMSLYLGDGTELLVTVSYVRGPRASGPDPALPGDPASPAGGQVRRLVIMLRGAQQRFHSRGAQPGGRRGMGHVIASGRTGGRPRHAAHVPDGGGDASGRA